MARLSHNDRADVVPCRSRSERDRHGFMSDYFFQMESSCQTVIFCNWWLRSAL